MRYIMQITLRGPNFEVLKTSRMITLDPTADMTCDVGIGFGASELDLVARVRDISVTIKEDSRYEHHN